MSSLVYTILKKAEANIALSDSEARSILHAKGANLSFILAGAHALREKAFGNRAELCSIINAKSGRCAENCAFCAQSSHHNTQTPVYALKSGEEIVAGAISAEKEGSHCYGIVTSGTRVTPGEEFDRLLAAGLLDAFRVFEPGGGHYTWWSNRAGVRAKNIGWRIDYFLVSGDLRPRLRGAGILPHVTGSDHCPVTLDLV